MSCAVHVCPFSVFQNQSILLHAPPIPPPFVPFPLAPSHSPAYSHSSYGRYDPTIEDSYSVTRTIDGLPYFLSLTDTAGQEEYRGLWAASNLQSDAFLLVYDITNASSLDALDYFMDMIDIEEENRMEEINNAELRGVKGGKEIRAPPVKIVAGNKCDLKDSRVVSSRTGLEWARQRRCGFMETSAREMVNIEETFACKSPISPAGGAAQALLPPAER